MPPVRLQKNLDTPVDWKTNNGREFIRKISKITMLTIKTNIIL